MSCILKEYQEMLEAVHTEQLVLIHFALKI